MPTNSALHLMLQGDAGALLLSMLASGVALSAAQIQKLAKHNNKQERRQRKSKKKVIVQELSVDTSDTLLSPVGPACSSGAAVL